MAENGKEIIFNWFPKPQPKAFQEGDSQLNVPEWNEVIHIIPERWYTKDEQQRRRRRRFARIANSNVPEFVENVGTIMTFIDDMEDYLTTMAVIGRVIAPKLAPRLVPYVGWVLLGADILDLLQVWRFVMPSGAFGKGDHKNLTELNPFGTKAKFRRSKRLLRKVPVVGEWLEILQTTDNIFGIGISLGPIVGLIEETVFDTFRLLDNVVPGIGQWNNFDNHTQFLMMNGGMWWIIPLLTDEEFLHYLTASSYAWSRMAWFHKQIIAEDPPARTEEPIRAPQIRTTFVKEILEENNVDPDKEWKWPSPDQTRAYRFIDFTQEKIELAVKYMADRIKKLEHMQEDWYAGTVMHRVAVDLAETITGEEDNLEIKLAFEEVMKLRIIDVGVTPFVAHPKPDWDRFLDLAKGIKVGTDFWPILADYIAGSTKFKKVYLNTTKPQANIQIGDFELIKPEGDEPADPDLTEEDVVELMDIPLPDVP